MVPTKETKITNLVTFPQPQTQNPDTDKGPCSSFIIIRPRDRERPLFNLQNLYLKCPCAARPEEMFGRVQPDAANLICCVQLHSNNIPRGNFCYS